MKRRTKRRSSLLYSLTQIGTRRQGNTTSGRIYSPMSMVNLLSKLRKVQFKTRMLKMWSGALYKDSKYGLSLTSRFRRTPAVEYALFYHIRNSLVASNNEMVGEGGEQSKERKISGRFERFVFHQLELSPNL